MYLGRCSKCLTDLKLNSFVDSFSFQYKMQQINRENLFQAATMEFTPSQEARCHNEHSPLLIIPPRRWVLAITEPLLASSAATGKAGEGTSLWPERSCIVTRESSWTCLCLSFLIYKGTNDYCRAVVRIKWENVSMQFSAILGNTVRARYLATEMTIRIGGVQWGAGRRGQCQVISTQSKTWSRITVQSSS